MENSTDRGENNAPEVSAPQEELVRLALYVADANHLASHGHKRQGHLVLLSGLMRAGTLRREGSPGAVHLHALWEKALADYLAQHPEAAQGTD